MCGSGWAPVALRAQGPRLGGLGMSSREKKSEGVIEAGRGGSRDDELRLCLVCNHASITRGDITRHQLWARADAREPRSRMPSSQHASLSITLSLLRSLSHLARARAPLVTPLKRGGDTPKFIGRLRPNRNILFQLLTPARSGRPCRRRTRARWRCWPCPPGRCSSRSRCA